MNQVQSIGFLPFTIEFVRSTSRVYASWTDVCASVLKLHHDYSRDTYNRSLLSVRVITMFKDAACLTLIGATAFSTLYAAKNFFTKNKSATNDYLNTVYRRSQLGQAVIHILDLTVNHDNSLEYRSRRNKLITFTAVQLIAQYIIQNETTHLDAYNTSTSLAKRHIVPGIAPLGLRQVYPLESRVYRSVATYVQALVQTARFMVLIEPPQCRYRTPLRRHRTPLRRHRTPLRRHRTPLRRYSEPATSALPKRLQKFLQTKRKIGPYLCAISTDFSDPDTVAQYRSSCFYYQRRLLAHVRTWTVKNWKTICRDRQTFNRFMKSEQTQKIVSSANTEAKYGQQIEDAMSSNKRLEALCCQISFELPKTAVLDPTNYKSIYNLESITAWLNKNTSSPVTRKYMTEQNLIKLPKTNVLISGVIEHLYQHYHSDTTFESLINCYLDKHQETYRAAIQELTSLGVTFDMES